MVDNIYREMQQLYAYKGHWVLEYKQKNAVDNNAKRTPAVSCWMV